MVTIVPYPDALARVRDVLAFHAPRPTFLTRSLELEDAARRAARSALRDGITSVSLLADLGRVAAETIEHDPGAAVAAGRAMARWAAREYHEAAGAAPSGSGA